MYKTFILKVPNVTTELHLSENEEHVYPGGYWIVEIEHGDPHFIGTISECIEHIKKIFIAEFDAFAESEMNRAEGVDWVHLQAEDPELREYTQEELEEHERQSLRW